MRTQLPIGDIPHADLSRIAATDVAIAGGQESSISAECHGSNRVLVPVEQTYHCSGLGIKESHHPHRIANSQQSSVRAAREAPRRPLGPPSCQQIASLGIPSSHRMVIGQREEFGPIRSEGDEFHMAAVLLKHMQRLAARRIPNSRGAVPCGARQARAVRAVGQIVDDTAVASQDSRSAALDVPQPNGPIKSAGCQCQSVRTKCCGLNRARVAAKRKLLRLAKSIKTIPLPVAQVFLALLEQPDGPAGVVGCERASAKATRCKYSCPSWARCSRLSAAVCSTKALIRASPLRILSSLTIACPTAKAAKPVRSNAALPARNAG